MSVKVCRLSNNVKLPVIFKFNCTLADQYWRNIHHAVPISKSALQRRLGLNSRGTLSIPARATFIENARIKQLRDAGPDSPGKKRRNTLQEQNERLKEKIVKLKGERDALIEKPAMVINGIQAKGYNLEELMMPLRNL